MSNAEKEVAAICRKYGVALKPGYRKDALIALYEQGSSMAPVIDSIDMNIYDTARLILQLECTKEGFSINVERISASYSQDYRAYLLIVLNSVLRNACIMVGRSEVGCAQDDLPVHYSLAVPCQEDKSNCVYVGLTKEEKEHIDNNNILPLSAIEKIVAKADHVKQANASVKGRSSYNALLGLYANDVIIALEKVLHEEGAEQPGLSQTDTLNFVVEFMHKSGLFTRIKGPGWVRMFMDVKNKDGEIDGKERKSRADAVKSWIKAAEKGM